MVNNFGKEIYERKHLQIDDGTLCRGKAHVGNQNILCSEKGNETKDLSVTITLNLSRFDLSRNQCHETHLIGMGPDTQHWIPERTVNLTAEKRKCNQTEDIHYPERIRRTPERYT